MAEIKFLAGENSVINNLAGSGLGFYGANFGQSVAVGEWQQTTFITNADGTSQGPACDNIRFANQGSGYVNSQTSGVPLRYIPNVNATLNIRFEHDTPVKTQNVKVYVHDRTSIDNNASGVTTKIAELIHPDPIQNGTGSGNLSWVTFSGVSTQPVTSLPLTASPGSGGHHANGVGDWNDTVHDWYLAISASPDSIGSKDKFGLYVSLEYL